MPKPSPSSETYSRLIALLSPALPQVLELDVLPSSYHSKIYSAPASVALTKPLLASLFLAAHHAFFSYLSSQREQNCDREGGQENGHTPALDDQTSSPYTAAFQATIIILLWDPNHLTAANFRKRHLLTISSPALSSRHYSASASGHRPQFPQPSSANPTLLQALIAELSLLTSLLTSPLPKHTKSSTLWSHRLFLLHTFGVEISTLVISNLPPIIPHSCQQPPASTMNDDDKKDETSPQYVQLALWGHELAIILKAGDRHPRNYYAWNYARELLTAFSDGTIIKEAPERMRGEDKTDITRKLLAKSSIAKVQKWCLSHPRDISGWSFLEALLRTGFNGREKQRARMTADDESINLNETGQGGLGAENGEGADEARSVVRETKEFVRKFQWRGASVEWFLRVMADLDRPEEG